MLYLRHLFLGLFLGFGLLACSDDKPQGAETSSEPESLAERLDKWSSESGPSTEPLDYQALKDLLPRRLDGMKRIDHSGEHIQIWGFRVAKAEAHYEEGDRQLDILLIEGDMLALAKLGVDQADLSFERESDEGYERTSTVDGHKCIESYVRSTGASQLMVFPGDRTVVEMNGHGLDEGDLRRYFDRLGLSKLARTDR